MITFNNDFGTIEMTCDNDGCTYSQEFEGSGGECDLCGAVGRYLKKMASGFTCVQAVKDKKY